MQKGASFWSAAAPCRFFIRRELNYKSNILKRERARYSLIRPDAPAQGANVAVIGEQHEVAHVALRILLPVAMASILSLESTAAILPQSPGQKLTIGCWVSFIDCLGLSRVNNFIDAILSVELILKIDSLEKSSIIKRSK